MKTITTNHIQQLAFLEHPDATIKASSRAYQIDLAPRLSCIVLTTEPASKAIDSCYEVLFIGPNKAIYDFQLIVPDKDLVLELFSTMKANDPDECFSLISQFGYAGTSELPISIEKILNSYGLNNAFTAINHCFNSDAVTALKQAGLGVVPSIYNWLVEPDNQSGIELRCKAFKRLPLILMTRLKPTKFSTLPPSKVAHANSCDKKMMGLTQAIDQGIDVLDAVSTHYQYSREDLKRIEFLLPWQVGEFKDPDLRLIFKNEVLLCKQFIDI